jgi:hypothetical protein
MTIHEIDDEQVTMTLTTTGWRVRQILKWIYPRAEIPKARGGMVDFEPSDGVRVLIQVGDHSRPEEEVLRDYERLVLGIDRKLGYGWCQNVYLAVNAGNDTQND